MNCLTQEKDNEIEKLHLQIAQLQQQNCCINSESLLSFEKHETAISAKENEKEVNTLYFYVPFLNYYKILIRCGFKYLK